MGADDEVPDVLSFAATGWPRLAEGGAEDEGRDEAGPVILTLPCPCCGRPGPPRSPAA